MSSNMRIGGLASGMDIDQLVMDLMKVERMKVDKLEQEKQTLEWQQEDFRTINSTFRSFRDNHVFKMRLTSTFQTKLATSSNKDAVAVSASASAAEGTHSIKVTRLAQGAAITGAEIGSSDNKTTLKNQISSLGDQEKLLINGTVFKFDPNKESIYDVVRRINNQRVEGVASHIIKAAVDADPEKNIVGEKQVQTLEFSENALVNGLVIKIGNKSVGLYDANGYGIESEAKLAMGVDYAYKIEDLAGPDKVASLVEKLKTDLAADNVELTIDPANTRELTITSKEVGIAKAVTATVSGGKEWTVRASYDETLDRFFLTTSKTGKEHQINLDSTALSDALKLTEAGKKLYTSDIVNSTVPTGVTYKEGLNANVVIDDLVINDVYTTNNISLNGITYNIYNTTETAVQVTISQDAEGVYNTIKSFVDEYNKTLELIEGKLNEKRYKDYTWPLTDEQREKLTDDQIDQWKERARSGLLRGDDTLRQIRDKMRLTVASLSKIGITTTADYTTGKLEITEQGEKKLREAIANDLDGIVDLFTDSSQGIAQKLSDSIGSTITTIIDKAGMTGNKTDDESYLGKRIDNVNDDIDSWEDRLTQIEDRYWRQFSAMEQALNQLNQQSAWLMQQFGSGA
ncbi:hypothetical protein JCM14036_14960 [Desulfotomaculum defluvii]